MQGRCIILQLTVEKEKCSKNPNILNYFIQIRHKIVKILLFLVEPHPIGYFGESDKLEMSSCSSSKFAPDTQASLQAVNVANLFLLPPHPE